MVRFLREPKLCFPDCLPNASDLLIFYTSLFLITLSITACDEFDNHVVNWLTKE